MQTVLSEMFNDMLNTPLQPLTFTEKGYYGRCDNCERIQNLIKVNNTKILCEKCHSILSLFNQLDDKKTIDIDFKEELAEKALEMQLKKISNKQQAIDEILKLSDKLKILIRLNNKIIQKIKEEMSKLYITTEDDIYKYHTTKSTIINDKPNN